MQNPILIQQIKSELKKYKPFVEISPNEFNELLKKAVKECNFLFLDFHAFFMRGSFPLFESLVDFTDTNESTIDFNVANMIVPSKQLIFIFYRNDAWKNVIENWYARQSNDLIHSNFKNEFHYIYGLSAELSGMSLRCQPESPMPRNIINSINQSF